MGFVSKREDDMDRYYEGTASLNVRSQAQPLGQDELKEDLEQYTLSRDIALSEAVRCSERFLSLSAQSREHPLYSRVGIDLGDKAISHLHRFIEMAGEVMRLQDHMWRVERRLD